MLYGDDDDDDSAKRSLQPPPFLHSLGTQLASVMQCAGRVGWNTCRSRALAAATTLSIPTTDRLDSLSKESAPSSVLHYDTSPADVSRTVPRLGSNENFEMHLSQHISYMHGMGVVPATYARSRD